MQGIVFPSSIQTRQIATMIARSLFARPFLRMATRPLRLRQFHVSPPRRYAVPEQPNWEEMMRNDPKLQDTLAKLARHPSALQAMQNVSRIIKDQGTAAHSLLLADHQADRSGLLRLRSQHPTNQDGRGQVDDEQRIQRSCQRGSQTATLLVEVGAFNLTHSAQLTEEMQKAGIEINPDVSDTFALAQNPPVNTTKKAFMEMMSNK
jgi:hypothetical protein